MRLGSAVLIIIPLLISLALRLYPALISGLPFSIDAWPLLRNTEALLKYTPINLDESVFDGYNNYWPASSIFSAMLSQVAGLSPMVAMALGLPVAAALAIPLFYMLTYKLLRRRTPAFLTSVVLAVAFPYALSTAGAIKEAYANPIYALLILIFLGLRGWRSIVAFALSSIALVMAHHLTSIAALLILASITLSTSLRSFLRGVDIDWVPPALTSTLAASIILYFMVYAHGGVRVAVSLSDLITAASYQTVMFALALYLTRSPRMEVSKWVRAKYLIAAIIPALILIFCTIKRVTPEAPILPRRYIVYGIPFIISAPLAALGFGGLREADGEGRGRFEPIFWLASILGLEAYAAFGNPPMGLTLAYRLINFTWPPLAMLCGYGAYKLYSTGGGSAAKLLVAAAIALMVALSCYSSYAAVLVGERYMGYFWLYRFQEFRAGAWVSSLCDNRTVTGDVKYAYLLRNYFGANYDELQGLLYLSGKTSAKPNILVTYEMMKWNGYVVYGGYSVDLPKGWIERAYNLSLIYSNSIVDIYTNS